MICRLPSGARPLALAIAASLTAALASCTPEAPADGAEGSAPEEARVAGTVAGQLFERSVVFVGTVGDSTLIVPWLFTARTRPGGVERSARAWLERGGQWEPFFEESWQTEPTRVPRRLHPRGALRLVMAQGEALEAVVFEGGPRRLEVSVGTALAGWSGTHQETYVVAEGAALLADRRVPGLVLDFERPPRGDAQPAGDWMFLTSGDSLVVVLAGMDLGGSGPFEGWGRIAGQPEIGWPDVTVSWVETRQFDRARREVPVRWSFAAGGGDMAGDLEARATHIEAHEGEGPLLPLEALFEVVGTLRLGESDYPVRGLVRHVQR
jgi:hypothetical protein